jgi:hypothetical protein
MIKHLKRFLNHPTVFRCIVAFYLAWLVVGVIVTAITFYDLAHL